MPSRADVGLIPKADKHQASTAFRVPMSVRLRATTAGAKMFRYSHSS